MKNLYLIIAVVLIIAVAGYLGKNQIKKMFVGVNAPQPTATTTIAPNPLPATATSSALINTRANKNGMFRTAQNDMTLYIFDKDTKPGASACYDSCAQLWPPYITTQAPNSLPADVGTIKRTDGKTQYTYKNMPLYFYTPDKKPGDILGNGIGGVWHLVKP